MHSFDCIVFAPGDTVPPSTSAIDAGAIGHLLPATLDRLNAIRFADGLWTRRLDLWSEDVTVQQRVAGRLGWLTAPDVSRSHVDRLESFARQVISDGFTDVVLLGMGGSSLAPHVLASVFGAAPGHPRFWMLDSVDPGAVRSVMGTPATTLFIVASKSGTTIESNVLAAEARRRVELAGHTAWGSRFVAITDEGTELHARAQAQGFRDVFVNPSDIGGRYSALSLFGLVPAALMGIPLRPFLEHATRMAEACRIDDAGTNPGLALGAVMAAAALAGRDKLTLLLPPRLASLGLWVEQLVAESTGKQGAGVIPIDGTRDNQAFGTDRAAVVVRMPGEEPSANTVTRLRSSGAPVVTLDVPDAAALGAEFFRWEVATATAGLLLGVNPFDEPNVAQAKAATTALLQAYAVSGALPVPERHAGASEIPASLTTAARQALAPDGGGHGSIDGFLRIVQPPDYLALLVFSDPNRPQLDAILQRFLADAARATNVATSLGYGPRYLHSTGQLHKGGPPTGVFIVIATAPAADLPIPGEQFSFATLLRAQALGDFSSLERTGRRALLLDLPDDLPQTFQQALRTLLPAR